MNTISVLRINGYNISVRHTHRLLGDCHPPRDITGTVLIVPIIDDSCFYHLSDSIRKQLGNREDLI